MTGCFEGERNSNYRCALQTVLEVIYGRMKRKEKKKRMEGEEEKKEKEEERQRETERERLGGKDKEKEVLSFANASNK